MSTKLEQLIDEANARRQDAAKRGDGEGVRIYHTVGLWLSQLVDPDAAPSPETGTAAVPTCRLCDWAFTSSPCDKCPDPAAWHARRAAAFVPGPAPEPVKPPAPGTGATGPCPNCENGSGYVRHVGLGNDEVVEDCPDHRAPAVPAAEPGKPATSMPSLINQLMMGADAWAQLANQNLPGLSHAASQALYEERSLRARQYRERAERIRYWIARAKAFRDNPNVPLEDMSGPMVVSMLEIICGEVVPPESAGEPGKPATCETCKDRREVLYMYPRGPGDPPGNQMIPCPACRRRATPGKGGLR